jgi:hypothetical protein
MVTKRKNIKMPLIFEDSGSGVLYGLAQINIGGTLFYAEDMGGSAPVEVKNLLDEVGSPRKAVGVRQKKTGTYTVSCDATASKATLMNALSMSVVAADAPSGSAFIAWITSRDISKSNEDFCKVTIGWEEKLN